MYLDSLGGSAKQRSRVHSLRQSATVAGLTLHYGVRCTDCATTRISRGCTLYLDGFRSFILPSDLDSISGSMRGSGFGDAVSLVSDRPELHSFVRRAPSS